MIIDFPTFCLYFIGSLLIWHGIWLALGFLWSFIKD